MFLSRWLYYKNNYKNNKNNNKRFIAFVDDFWDTDGSDGDEDWDGDDYTYSPPSRFFCKISKDRKLKKITEMVLYKKKWAPWNKFGAFGF
jgi:hypothetical protein